MARQSSAEAAQHRAAYFRSIVVPLCDATPYMDRSLHSSSCFTAVYRERAPVVVDQDFHAESSRVLRLTPRLRWFAVMETGSRRRRLLKFRCHRSLSSVFPVNFPELFKGIPGESLLTTTLLACTSLFPKND